MTVRRASFHGHGFSVAADGQREIQAGSPGHFHYNTGLVDGLEAGCLHGEVISAWKQRGNAVFALSVCTLSITARALATARPDGSVIKPESSAFWARKRVAVNTAITNSAIPLSASHLLSRFCLQVRQAA